MACVSFLNSSKISGISLLFDIVNFGSLCEDVDYVLTGEGKLDTQSFGGKVIGGIIQRSKNKKVKVLAIVGCSELSQDETRVRGGLYAFVPCVENKISPTYWHQSTEQYKQLLHGATRKIIEVIQKEERE